jgi:hypothetical protein
MPNLHAVTPSCPQVHQLSTGKINITVFVGGHW